MVLVCPQDIVTSCPYSYALSYQRPRLRVPVPPDLPEVEEEVYQPELLQQVKDLLYASTFVYSVVWNQSSYFRKMPISLTLPNFCQANNRLNLIPEHIFKAEEVDENADTKDEDRKDNVINLEGDYTNEIPRTL